MTSNAPWSVKGIEPNAREAAKDQARRAGMTLGEWLTRRIQDEADEGGEAGSAARGPLSKALDRLTARIEIAEQRSTLAVTGIDQSVRGVLARLEITERDQVALGARFEGALNEVSETQNALIERIARVEDHTSGPRSLEAIKGLEGQVARIANQVYDAEGRQRETNADLRRDLGALAALVESGGGSGDDGAGIAQRLDQAEARTTAALRALEVTSAQLDRRLEAAEDRLEAGGDTGALERRLSEIAANLTSGLEAARVEMGEQLRASADSRFDRMEQALREMDSHVQAAEQRSSQAIEQMGREVLRVAEALSRKVNTTEQRAANAIEQVGGEVARVVNSLDIRLQRSETTQGHALDKLGADLTRVTEKLTERIGVAERRSAQAIDDVGEQISRVTERLNQRYDRSANDLAERIRQSEERTVRLLEEARERLDGRSSKASAAPETGFAPATVDLLSPPPFPGEPAAAIPTAGPPQYVIYPDVAPFGQAMAPAAMAAPGFAPVAEDFPLEDLDAASDFAATATPQTEADFVDDASRADFEARASETQDRLEISVDEDAEFEFAGEERAHDCDLSPPSPPPLAAEPVATLSTRELIEQARAAARAAQAERSGGGRGRRDAQRAGGGALSAGPFVTRRRKPDHSRTIMAASFIIAIAIIGGGAAIFYAGGAPEKITAWWSRPAAGVVDPDATVEPRLAVALNPQPISPEDVLANPIAPGAPGAEAEDLFSQGRSKVEAGDKGGAEQVRRAANLGHAGAQRYLASLYKTGRAGVAKDLPEARRWYERAAAGGDRQAMHEAGLMQHFGEGGPANLVSAAEWFRRAADLGSTDSQFNLAALYETGSGVSINPAEAYKWYQLAARDTDEAKRNQAREAANRVKAQLSAADQGAAERFAANFIPQTANVSARAVAPDYLTIQRALARLGYFRGAVNGIAGDDLAAAVREYQRDQGLAATGVLDPTTTARIRTAAR